MARKNNHSGQKTSDISEWNTIPVKTFKPKKTKINSTHQGKTKKKTTTVNNEDYWGEIAAVCVDGESLRLQEELLHTATKFLEAADIGNAFQVHAALENVHLFAGRVAMLKNK